MNTYTLQSDSTLSIARFKYYCVTNGINAAFKFEFDDNSIIIKSEIQTDAPINKIKSIINMVPQNNLMLKTLQPIQSSDNRQKSFNFSNDQPSI